MLITYMKALLKGMFSFLADSIHMHPSHNPIKVGHRGAAGICPENTFSSFEKAIQCGMEYIEIDLQMSKDGELVVIHDDTLNRTTSGRGRVSDFTLAELNEFDAGNWFHDDYKGEKIPSLAEVLDLYGGVIGLLIELKKPSLHSQMEEQLAKALHERGLTNTEKIIVQSFDKSSIKKFHRLVPGIPVGVLIRNRGVGIPARVLIELSQYATYVNPKKTMVTSKMVRKLHSFGLKTMVWTVRSRKEAEKLRRLGVDGIISDFPDLLHFD